MVWMRGGMQTKTTSADGGTHRVVPGRSGNFGPVQRTSITGTIRGLWLACWLLAMMPVMAQRDLVRLKGVVTEHYSGDPLGRVTVRLLKAGRDEAEVVTRANGKYAFDLDRGWRYAVYFSRKGMVTKHVVIDTQGIPPYPEVPFYEMDLQMTLFPWVEGLDLSPFESPLGEAAYSAAGRNMSWDTPYTEKARPVLSRTMDEYAKVVKGYYARTRTGRRPPGDPQGVPLHAPPAPAP